MSELICLGSGSSGNCYLLKHDGKTLILDAGVRWREIGPHVTPLRDVAGCLVTHAHKDHSLAVADMEKNGIRVFRPYDRVEQLRVQEWPPFRATSFPVPHDGEPCVGYYITFGNERMVYATDYEYIKYTFQGVKPTVLLIECNHMDDATGIGAKQNHVVLGHSSISTVEGIVRSNATEELREIILCHLSIENADEGEMISRISAVAGNTVHVSTAHKGIKWIF